MEWISVDERLPEAEKEMPSPGDRQKIIIDDGDTFETGWYSGSQFIAEDDSRLMSIPDVIQWAYITPPREDVTDE